MSKIESMGRSRVVAKGRWSVVLRCAWALSLVGCAAVTELDEPESLEQSLSSHAARPFAVGTRRIEVAVGEGRVLPVQLWYPAVESARAEAVRGRPLADIEPEGPARTLLLQLLETAPSPGTSHVLHAADAPPVLAQRQRFPLLIFSHCNECVRYSSLSVAEHLASLGFVVAAPDHVNNTLYDLLQGTSVGLDLEHFLPQRVVDVTKVLDTLLDDTSSVVPVGLRGRIDGERVGAFGHSFGGLTTGLFMQNDERIQAGAILAIPISAAAALTPEQGNVVFADPAAMTKPVLFIKAAEDFALFNSFIDDNYAHYAGEAWRVTIRDTAHYSVTDICGIAPNYDLGSCSPAMRQTDPTVSYTPLDIVRARDLTRQYVGAFFLDTLLGRGRGPRGVPRDAAVNLTHKR